MWRSPGAVEARAFESQTRANTTPTSHPLRRPDLRTQGPRHWVAFGVRAPQERAAAGGDGLVHALWGGGEGGQSAFLCTLRAACVQRESRAQCPFGTSLWGDEEGRCCHRCSQAGTQIW